LTAFDSRFSQERLDPAAQRREARALGHKGVGAAGQRQLLGLVVLESSHRDDPRGLGRRRLLHAPADLEAIQPGHAEVEHQKMRLEGADFEERFVAAAHALDGRAG
jgi:hypothetical protein